MPLLTDVKCKNAIEGKKPYKMADFDGLYLHVMPNGSKYWRMKYRFAGVEKCLAFGVYPTVSLLEAREKRDASRKLIAAGKDPSFARKEEKQLIAQNAANTFEVVTREWHERNKRKWTEVYAQHIINRMEADMFPAIGKLPIAGIKPRHILAALDKIEDRGAHEMAKRALQYCRQVFQYAVITEYVADNPTKELSRQLRPAKHGHFASIEPDDIPDFLKVLARNDARLFAQTRRAMELMMLTFVRTSELIEAEWSEFNLDEGEWIIPAIRMKMKRVHIAPLSMQARKILREQFELTGKCKFVFPSQTNPRRCMSNMTILKALERMGYKGKMTGHGFRALAMTTLKEKLDYRHEVIDMQLAHAKNKATAPYDRSVFLKERRRMMQDWADYLDKVAKDEGS